MTDQTCPDCGALLDEDCGDCSVCAALGSPEYSSTFDPGPPPPAAWHYRIETASAVFTLTEAGTKVEAKAEYIPADELVHAARTLLAWSRVGA